MGLHQLGALWSVGIGFICWLAVVAYMFFLARRRVQAVEGIARKFGS